MFVKGFPNFRSISFAQFRYAIRKCGSKTKTSFIFAKILDKIRKRCRILYNNYFSIVENLDSLKIYKIFRRKNYLIWSRKCEQMLVKLVRQLKNPIFHSSCYRIVIIKLKNILPRIHIENDTQSLVDMFSCVTFKVRHSPGYANIKSENINAEKQCYSTIY